MAKTITLPKRVVDFSLSIPENAHLTNAETAIARVLAHVEEIPTAVKQHARRTELGIRLRAIADQITEAMHKDAVDKCGKITDAHLKHFPAVVMKHAAAEPNSA